MSNDPCKNEKTELEKAKNELQTHMMNPLDWDIESDKYQEALSKLKNEVARKEKILHDCEEKNK